MAALEIKLTGNAQQQLSQMQYRLANPAKLMEDVSAELASLTEKAFDKEGSPERWQSLAASTIKARTKRGHWPGKILQESGAGGMAASVTPSSNAGEARLTSAKPYSAIQQLGGKAGKGGKVLLPSRPYMPFRKSGEDYKLTGEADKSIKAMLESFLTPKI
jgi:phage virion morphogenesis protein